LYTFVRFRLWVRPTVTKKVVGVFVRFVRRFIRHSFHSFIHSSSFSFIHSSIHPFISLTHPSLITSLITSFIHSSIHPIHITSFSTSFVILHSFTYHYHFIHSRSLSDIILHFVSSLITSVIHLSILPFIHSSSVSSRPHHFIHSTITSRTLSERIGVETNTHDNFQRESTVSQRALVDGLRAVIVAVVVGAEVFGGARSRWSPSRPLRVR
jgi:hypothetical protein